MPFIGSRVTVKLTPEKEEVLKQRLAKAADSILGKKEEYLMIGFEDEYELYFGGEKLEKGAFIEVKICGQVRKRSFNEMTAEVCRIYEEELGIPQDKIYVKYEEVENWGWNGSDF
ncbi:MAG: phenylpyruvate tautomerase MIF-related protein [Clostridium sp.]|nr:phenylpyruvate tautomerase MIF-related protein [Clostridium sp.]